MEEREEQIRDFRCTYLIKECGQLTFRSIIEKELKDKAFSDFLCENNKMVHNLHEIRVITDEDYVFLYPQTGLPSLEDVGFTLLYILIRTFFCDLSCDDPIWYKGSKPDANDISRAADIIRLRNQIKKLDENRVEFGEDNEEMINDLKTIFTRLSPIDTFQQSFELSKTIAFNDENREALQVEFGKWKEVQQRFEAGLDLEITESKSRRFRLYSLLVDGGTRVFRHIFDDKVPPCKLIVTLSKTENKNALLKQPKPLISKSQEELLYPSKGPPKSTTFDITLLALLLRYVCGFNKSDRCWSAKQLLSTDNSVIADITRIRELRNEIISHLPQTGNLTKKDFERLWDKISKILIRLNGGCNDPFENLQSEIDDLKRKPLDPQFEKELFSILNEWRNSDESLESKIMKYLQESHLDSSFELSKETVKDVLDDQYFVKTEQFNIAKEKLLQNRVIVLNGAPGEGKTTVAKKLLIEVSKSQRYRHLHSYVEWEKVNIESVDAILIDDMFGSGSFDKEEYRKWKKHIPSITAVVKHQRMYVIITSRTYILSEVLEKLFVKSIFSEANIVELSSEKLTDVEKNEILHTHFSKASNESALFSDIVNTTKHAKIVSAITELKLGAPGHGSLAIGFPECARLFTSNISLYKKGVEFFTEPMSCVKSYMSELLGDDDTLIAFFVLWAQESKSLNSLELERPINETAEQIKGPISKLQYMPDKYIRKIRHVLRQHRGGFIQHNESDETFKFSHRVVQDAVGLVTYEINPTAVIELSDVAFIENCIHIKTTNVTRTENDAVSLSQVIQIIEPMKIHLRQARYNQISIRLGSIFIRSDSNTLENADTLVRLSIFDNQDFCSAFMKYLSTEGYLESFLKTKLRSLLSEFALFTFLSKASIEDMGVVSYLIWLKEDVSPLMEFCLKIMSPLEIEKELNLSLLISVKLGSCKLVSYLLEKGAKVDFNHISLAIVTDRTNLLEQLCSVPKHEIMHRACKEGYVEVVKKIINHTLDLTLPDEKGKSLIENAIDGGKKAIFEMVVTQLPQLPNINNISGNVPLYHYIILKNNPDLIDVLIEKGIPPSTVDRDGRTPFLYAISLGKKSIIDKLLKLSIQENVHCLPDNEKNTPLYMTVSKYIRDDSESYFSYLALELCRFGENIHLKTSRNDTTLELASKRGLVKIVNAILAHGDPHRVNGSSIFHHFVTIGNVKGVLTLLKCNIDPNIHDKFHRTPFVLANALGKRMISNILKRDKRITNYNKLAI